MPRVKAKFDNVSYNEGIDIFSIYNDKAYGDTTIDFDPDRGMLFIEGEKYHVNAITNAIMIRYNLKGCTWSED